MSIPNAISSISSFDAGATTQTQKKSPGVSFKALLDQLNSYAEGTTSQRLEKQILAKLGISEDDLKNASPEAREKIAEMVRNILKQEMTAQAQQTK